MDSRVPPSNDDASNDPPSNNPPSNDPLLWEAFYQAAISEPNPKLRLQRIAEAQKFILQRAKQLNEESGPDAECLALEDAAEFLQALKLESAGDGIGKQIETGDADPIDR